MSFDQAVWEQLSRTIRKAAQPRTWSRGVLLARDGAVATVESDDDEIVLSVHAQDRPVPPTVVLYPHDEEWDCDCGGRLDVCPHVAAAVIALAQTGKDEDGEGLPDAQSKIAKVRYRLALEGGLVKVERLRVEPDGTTSLIPEPVKVAASKRPNGVSLILSEADLALERFLKDGTTVIDRREQAKLLFERLSKASEVTLGDEPVEVKKDLALPVGRIEKHGQRYDLVIEADPAVERVVAPDIVKMGKELRLVGESHLCGPKLQRLPFKKSYGPSEVAVLMQEVLPMYEGRFVITGQDRLPRARGTGRPRLDLQVAIGETAVSVTPQLVYGDPPSLRIENGRPSYVQGVAPERDFEAERKLVEALRDELNLVVDQTMTVRGGDGAAFLQKVRTFEGTRGRGLDEASLPTLSPQLDIQPDGSFHLSFEAEDEDGETKAVDARAALAAFETGHAMVPLLGGGWAKLSASWWRDHADEVALLLHLRDKDGQLPPFGLPALGALASALDEPPPPGLEKLAPLFAGFDRLPGAALPSDLTATLRDYQRHGVDWMSYLGSLGLGALLADDMGLGKTLQTICVLKPRSLVVVPTSVLDNWKNEIQKFRPSLKVYIHHGPRRQMDETADVVLTTYALLRSDKALLGKERWAVAVLDEAQAIKNPDSQSAKAAFGLNADMRIALTGTPVENRLSELWSQLRFANPGLLGTRADFESRFEKPIESGDVAVQAKLRTRTKPFLLRRMKREVAKELPPRTDMQLVVELDELERSAYDGILFATRKEVVEKLDAGGSPLAALEALLRLRQAACHTGLLPGRSAEGSSKIDLLVETLEEAVSEGHKALVFSQWTSLLDLAEPWLTKSGIRFNRLDGSTKDRGAVVDAFQADGGPEVMLLSLKAGGTGLNLTVADHVFLLDPWWNPAVEDQAADRAHRIGQERPVMVHRLVAKDTVEERILELQGRKRALAEAAVGGEAAAARITKDDLLALLEG